MSVINQMLKDLDQNQKSQTQTHGATLATGNATSSKKPFIMAIVVLVFLNLFGLYGWQLYSENQALKTKQIEHSKTSKVNAEELVHAVSKVMRENKAKIESGQTIEQPAIATNSASDQASVSERPEKWSSEVAENENIASEVNQIPVTQNQATHNKLTLNSVTQQTSTENARESSNDKVRQISPVSVSEKQATDEVLVESFQSTTPQVQPESVPQTKPKLSIARKRLTAEQLIETKLARAEQAVNANQLVQAQSLLEEVLLIDAHQVQARKQLAALWFGKQDYQAALNLLSQGLAISPDNRDLLVMKARIYLKQEQYLAALDTLLPYSNADSVEYQSLLATSAQQAQRPDAAISAYRWLVKLQPHTAKWWLGLASTLDSQGNFQEAAAAYQQAIQVGGLSSATVSFVNQRLQVIGVN